MRKLTTWLAGLGALALLSSSAPAAPRGRLVEVHSCHVYAGGCIVSSEATLGGRYMFRLWDFTGGDYAGTDLRGLQAGLLETASENLADSLSQPAEAVIYLPQAATEKQREALLNWLKATQPELKKIRAQTRTAPMQLAESGGAVSFSAGDFVSLRIASMSTCPKGGCGERVWYSPRSATSFFTVAVNQASQVREPLLQLKWVEGGTASAFLARFGEQPREPNLYVGWTEFCGKSGALF